MKLLKTHVHPAIDTMENKTISKRIATRSIALNGTDILVLYTQRYDDYSLPGGGVELGEDLVDGMKRELMEETGAKNIQNIVPFGAYEEYRPARNKEKEVQHMISYCYTCTVDKDLNAPAMESYEINNGMQPKWMPIVEAIAHNEKTIANSPKKGMSIERETFLLKQIANKLLENS